MLAGDEISASFLSVSNRTIDQLLKRMCPVIYSVPTNALLASELPAKSPPRLCCSYLTVVLAKRCPNGWPGPLRDLDQTRIGSLGWLRWGGRTSYHKEKTKVFLSPEFLSLWKCSFVRWRYFLFLALMPKEQVCMRLSKKTWHFHL